MLQSGGKFHAFLEAQVNGFIRQEKAFVFAVPDNQMLLRFLWNL